MSANYTKPVEQLYECYISNVITRYNGTELILSVPSCGPGCGALVLYLLLFIAKAVTIETRTVPLVTG